MTKKKFDRLVEYLRVAALELYEDHDLGFPETFEDFCRAMWQDDMDMETWNVNREYYRGALHEAWLKTKPLSP